MYFAKIKAISGTGQFSRAAAFLLLMIPAAAADLSAQQEAEGRISRAVTAYVEQTFKLPVGEAVIECRPFGANLPHEIPANAILRVLPPQKNLRRGSQILKCGIFRKGRLLKSVACRVHIRTFEPVVVTAESQPRHSFLKNENLALNRVETTKRRPDYFTSLEEVAGLRARRLLAAGEILDRDAVEPVPLLTRGKQVNILFVKNGLEIRMTGRVRQDGDLGEKIRVKCLQTSRTFQGKVLNKNTVLINLL